MLSSNKQLITNLYKNHINKHNLASLADVISPDYVDLASGEQGLQAYQKNIESLLVGFPDVHFEIAELIEEGDKVVARWQWVGTHQGPFAKTAATSRKIENVGVVIFTIKDGKVISTWNLVDRLRVMQQMSAT